MKITCTINDVVHPVELPYDGAAFVLVKDMHVCPSCEHKVPVVCGVQLKLKISGKNMRVESHDTYAADAHALCCGKRIGTLRTQMQTLFGVEEDARVLNGPWKVY